MDHEVTLGSRRLRWREAGDPNGPSLLLLHAFPLTSAMWRPQLETPPSGWRVLAPDFAGCGQSDDHDDEAVALDDYARDVLAILDSRGLDRAVFCGVSLGGYVALAIARLAAERLGGLVLADTKAAADSPEAREGRARMLAVLEERGVAGVADAMIPKLLGETTRRDRPELAAEVRSIVLTNRPAGIRRAILRLRDRPDARPHLATIAAPTLVIVGEEDVVTPPAEAEALQRGIAGASLRRIAAAGHLSSLERSSAFDDALGAFLQSVR